MKMNVNIVDGQYNHQIWTSLNHSSVLETRVRNRFPPPTSLSQQVQEEWYRILLETVQNLYESTSRRTVAVLMAKGGPTPY
jgi:hypothetical protein